MRYTEWNSGTTFSQLEAISTFGTNVQAILRKMEQASHVSGKFLQEPSCGSLECGKNSD